MPMTEEGAKAADARATLPPDVIVGGPEPSTLRTTFLGMLFLDRHGRQLGLLALGGMAGLFSRTALGPLQETLAVDLGLGDAEVALLQGPALAIPLVLLAIPLGLLIDRTARARLLLIALVLNVAGTAAAAFAPGFWSLFAARAIVGFAAPATGIIAYAMIPDLFPPEKRGRATTLVVLGQLLGSSGAFFVGGQLLVRLDAGDGAVWRLALLTMAAILAIPAFAALLVREPARIDTGQARSPVANAWSDLWQVRRRFVPLVIGMALVGLADGAALVWTAPTLARTFALPPDQVGALIGIVLLASGILGPLLGGWLADRCQSRGGPAQTVGVLAILATISLPCGLFSLMPTPATLGAALLIFLTLGPAISVMVTALTVIVMPVRVRGLCVTIKYATGTLVGIGAAPVIVGVLADALPPAAGLPAALALTCVATTLAGAIVLLRGRRHFPGVNAGR